MQKVKVSMLCDAVGTKDRSRVIVLPIEKVS